MFHDSYHNQIRKKIVRLHASTGACRSLPVRIGSDKVLTWPEAASVSFFFHAHGEYELNISLQLPTKSVAALL